MSRKESSSTYSEANKAWGRLQKQPYPRVLCGSKLHSHPQTLSTEYVHFAFLLTPFILHCRWMTNHHHFPCLVTVITRVGSKVIEMRTRPTLQIRTPSIIIDLEIFVVNIFVVCVNHEIKKYIYINTFYNKWSLWSAHFLYTQYQHRTAS